ncbi:MAG: zinc finger domain-containing protein [Streptococcus sp.]
MEGKYLLFTDQVPANKHFHFSLLDDGSTLSIKMSASLEPLIYWLKSQEEAYFTKEKLGPEPTKKTFKYAPFERALMTSAKPIKSLLLEQKLVAGLGNIYVDEVLWAAKVHPETPAKKLSKAAMKRVHDQTIVILQLGIEKGGSTIRTYRNALGEDGTMQNYLQVYGKTGQPCPRCASTIEKIKLGGRGPHLCPHCQKR